MIIHRFFFTRVFFTRVFFMMLFLGIPTQLFAWDPKEECPEPPKDSTQAQIVAGELFSTAEENYQNNKPIEALKGFLCSHRVIQHENTLFNIAQISKLDEHRESSVTLLKEFVQNTQGAHITQPIEEIIADLENRQPAETTTDDPAVSEQDPTADEDAATQPPKPEDTEAAPTSAQTNENSNHSNRGMKIAGIVLIGVGGASLVIGSIFQGLAGRSQNAAEQTEDYTEFQTEQDNIKTYQPIAIANFVGGTVVTATGLVLLLLSTKKESADAAEVAVVPTISGISVAGRF